MSMKLSDKLLVQTMICLAIFTAFRGLELISADSYERAREKLDCYLGKNYTLAELKSGGSELLDSVRSAPAALAGGRDEGQRAWPVRCADRRKGYGRYTGSACGGRRNGRLCRYRQRAWPDDQGAARRGGLLVRQPGQHQRHHRRARDQGERSSALTKKKRGRNSITNCPIMCYDIQGDILNKRITKEEIEKLYLKWKTPKHVIAHCRAVASVAATLGRELNKNGYSLDLSLIRGSALAHDVARVEEEHALKGAEILEGLGYCEGSGYRQGTYDLSAFSRERSDRRMRSGLPG